MSTYAQIATVTIFTIAMALLYYVILTWDSSGGIVIIWL